MREVIGDIWTSNADWIMFTAQFYCLSRSRTRFYNPSNLNALTALEPVLCLGQWSADKTQLAG